MVYRQGSPAHRSDAPSTDRDRPGLRALVKRGNKLCLRFPSDGFGAKGADLLQLFEILQQKWGILMEVAPRPGDEGGVWGLKNIGFGSDTGLSKINL